VNIFFTRKWKKREKDNSWREEASDDGEENWVCGYCEIEYDEEDDNRYVKKMESSYYLFRPVLILDFSSVNSI